MPDLWTSYFMLPCLEKGGRVYLRAQSIQSTLQRSRDCIWSQREILRDEAIRVLSDLWRTTPNGWRGKLEKFLEDDDSVTVSSTEDESLYENDTSDTESSWDGENTSDEGGN
ncbi:hypothetical protein V8C44DRAFT_342098 [Trichoderma aethiopicum]